VSRSQKRLLLLVASVPVLVIVSALAYMAGMAWLEGEPRSFWEAVSWAGESLSTTGYGADTSWRHPAMVVMVVAVQFIGVFLVFLIFPIYLIPFLEERFEARLPVRVPAELERHVVIYRWGPAVVGLLQRVESAGLESVVIEPDEAAARRLFDRGQRVVHGRLDDGVLEAAGLGRARALVANGSDDENAAVILAARQAGFGGEVVGLVEEPFHRKPMTLAGATAVFTPRHILGAALAARASARISPRVSGIQNLGRRLEVSEIRVEPGSPVAGLTLAEAAVGAKTGATVIGQWVEGRLLTQPAADTRLAPGGIAVVVGSREAVERVAGLLGGPATHRGGHFVVGGYGVVGRKVVDLLRDVGEQVRAIDRVAADGVDVVGDVLDQRVLEEAGLGEAQAIVLALETDSATLFATVIVKDVAPEVPVIARVNQSENVERIHRAGADFALSISQVSGQMLARRLLGEEAVAIDPQLTVRRVPTEVLAGRRPAELGIRERTGCSVVAVERGDRVLVELGGDFRFEPGDAVYVCGDQGRVDRFAEALAG
jgi:Trk K+ transport system NAD-binding subunit